MAETQETFNMEQQQQQQPWWKNIGIERPISETDVETWKLFEEHLQRLFIDNSGTIMFIICWILIMSTLSCIYLPLICQVLDAATFLWYILSAAVIIQIIFTALSGKFRYKYPLNLILLVVLTVLIVLIYVKLTCHFRDFEILAFFFALLFCLSAITGFRIYVHIRKTRMTVLGGILVGFLTLLAVFGIVCSTYEVEPMAYAAIAATLYLIYYVTNTFFIIDGLHFYSIKPDEYILGAYHLLPIDVFYIPIYFYYCCRKT